MIESSHDTLRDFIALKCHDIFGVSCIALKEVPAIVSGELRRADLVVVSRMGRYPYVRVIEVKTKFENFWDAINQLLWFKENGLANYYFIALPENIAKLLSYDQRVELLNKNIGLITIRVKGGVKGLEWEVIKEISPKSEVRKRDWDLLYRELEKLGEHSLVERLRETVEKHS